MGPVPVGEEQVLLAVHRQALALGPHRRAPEAVHRQALEVVLVPEAVHTLVPEVAPVQPVLAPRPEAEQQILLGLEWDQVRVQKVLELAALAGAAPVVGALRERQPLVQSLTEPVGYPALLVVRAHVALRVHDFCAPVLLAYPTGLPLQT